VVQGAPRVSDEDRCATRIITTLARRAYRRTIGKDEIAGLMIPYKAARQTASFEDGIRLALQRILVSPDFLFRVEVDPAKVPSGSAYRVRDVELASRLSFFLWSSGPDDELLGLAERGRLKEPAVLKITGRIELPKQFALSQNYPNPFNPSTTIEFSVDETGPAAIRVFNMSGQLVAVLFDGQAEKGRIHAVSFNGTGLPTGVYLARLESGVRHTTRKLVLLK